MVSLTLFAILLAFGYAGGAPIPGADAAHLCERDVRDGPRRTVADLIRSCIFTIIICVYRVVHPNIDDPAAPRWKRICRKISLSLYTLEIPELLIGWALLQRLGAEEIMNKVNETIPGLKF